MTFLCHQFTEVFDTFFTNRHNLSLHSCTFAATFINPITYEEDYLFTHGTLANPVLRLPEG